VLVLKVFLNSIRGFFLFSWLLLFSASHIQAAKIPEVRADSSSEPTAIIRTIRDVFPDEPRMVAVARCESGLVHRENGRLIRNRDGSSAEGVFQVLMRVHLPQMRKMALNPDRLDHYLAYVRYLYDQQGLTPWRSSRPCWGKKL
jgi:hypothetical protein